MDILKQLYEAIDDVNYKKYSGLDDETLKILDNINTQSISSVGLEFQVLNMAFLPNEVEQVKRVIGQVKKECGDNISLLARFSDYDDWLDTLDEISSAANIKNTATAILAMLKIIEKHIDEVKDLWIEDAVDKQWVPISSITGRSKIKASDGRVLSKAFDKMLSKGEIKKDDLTKGLLVLANKYLEDDKIKKVKDKKEKPKR